MKRLTITKELFEETIAAIESQYRHDEKCCKLIDQIFTDSSTAGYDNHWVNNQLMKLLQVAMKDNHVHSWIEYYMWELDFGRQYVNGCASRPDGSNILLRNSEDLWYFLNEK